MGIPDDVFCSSDATSRNDFGSTELNDTPDVNVNSRLIVRVL